MADGRSSGADPERPLPVAPSNDPLVQAEKTVLRAQLLAARGQRQSAERAAAQQANNAHLLSELAGASTVCVFLPLASEPLNLGLLDQLADRGTRVLVPVVAGASPLDWADYSAARAIGVSTTAGPLGISQLDAARLGPVAAASAEVIVVPALAIDGAGYRLGRGGGHYDRTLALVRRLAVRLPRFVGVLYDDERLSFLPHDGFDVPVNLVVTPSAGVVAVG